MLVPVFIENSTQCCILLVMIILSVAAALDLVPVLDASYIKLKYLHSFSSFCPYWIEIIAFNVGLLTEDFLTPESIWYICPTCSVQTTVFVFKYICLLHHTSGIFRYMCHTFLKFLLLVLYILLKTLFHLEK